MVGAAIPFCGEADVDVGAIADANHVAQYAAVLVSAVGHGFGQAAAEIRLTVP
jgi:hypothetical protein